MTREAALMGIPTFSLFAGAQPAVDRWLEERGALHRMTDLRQLEGAIRKRDHPPRAPEDLRASGRETLATFVEATIDAAQR